MSGLATRATALATAIGGVLTFLVIAVMDAAIAQPVRAAGSASTTPEALTINAPHAPDTPDAPVFTDTYDTAWVNDALGNATFLGNYGTVACSAPALAAYNATFWRAALSNPALDVDRYRLDLTDSHIFTFIVVSQTPSDLSFAVQLNDLAGNVLFAQPSGAAATFSIPPSLGLSAVYLTVQAADIITIEQTERKPYAILLCSEARPRPTPTPIRISDLFEPNDTPDQARAGGRSFIPTGVVLLNLNFYTTTVGAQDQGDVDWYFFYARRHQAVGGSAGCYQITTDVQPGVDTEIFLYAMPPASNTDESGLILSNDDYQLLNRGSRLRVGFHADGTYWLKVWNRDTNPRTPGQTYRLTLIETPPTAPTAVPTIGITPIVSPIATPTRLPTAESSAASVPTLNCALPFLNTYFPWIRR